MRVSGMSRNIVTALPSKIDLLILLLCKAKGLKAEDLHNNLPLRLMKQNLTLHMRQRLRSIPRQFEAPV